MESRQDKVKGIWTRGSDPWRDEIGGQSMGIPSVLFWESEMALAGELRLLPQWVLHGEVMFHTVELGLLCKVESP